MQKNMLRRGTVLMVAVIAAAVGGIVPSAFAKKAPAPVAQTGQAISFAEGDDGDLQAGIPFPTPRFTDNTNGTVTDNLTGLIWLRDANCFGGMSWADALGHANTLAHGSCGLMDKSKAGDWRLPNIKELLSLIDYGFVDLTHVVPALSNAAGTAPWSEGDAFFHVQADLYWSSTSPTTQPLGQASVWRILLTDGHTNHDFSADTSFVWPVRAGK